MAQNRELGMEDYLAMARRRLKVILIPLLIAPVAGFLISYVFPPKYTSQSMILVEGQKVPTNYVVPVITADFTQRIASLQQQMLSGSRLRPVIQSLGLVKTGEEGKLMEDIRSNMTVTPVITSISAASSTSGSSKKKAPSNPNDEPMPGFYIGYTNRDAGRAQKICSALTSLMVDENLRSRADIAKGTTDFLGRQVEDAKRAIDDQDAKLAAFKKQYMGQLPGDVDTNLRMLASLNSQLDASTQTLSRAQQDKSYAESMLAQQVAAWKASQATTNPQTLEQQLSVLQAQLMQLEARYTDDHPDVIKTKSDIAKVQARLDEVNKQMNNAAPVGDTSIASGDEPPEIKQLRLQLHQYRDVIEQSALDQKKLQAQINVYQRCGLRFNRRGRNRRNGSGRRRLNSFLHQFDLGHEAVAAPAHCLNVAGRLRICRPGLAQLAHGRVQAVFKVNKCVVGPQLLVQLLAANQLPAPLGQSQQKAAWLFLQAHRACHSCSGLRNGDREKKARSEPAPALMKERLP